MSSAEGVPGLRIERLRPGMPAAFRELLRIYREAIPSSERKDDAVLGEMLARDDYEFRVAQLEDGVVGFTIVKSFHSCDASLLEYMAVDRTKRGSGIGSLLFRHASSADSTIARYVLIEVEDAEEVVGLSEDSQRRRRKAFYRANGCREVAELAYLMPTVSAERPPPMKLMIYRRHLPEAIDKTELRRWLEGIYVEVYRQSARDVRIAQMLAAVPNRIGLQ
jgi:GNAT superfamily N-acetyltransferase